MALFVVRAFPKVGGGSFSTTMVRFRADNT
jgi:hypothetical protein